MPYLRPHGLQFVRAQRLQLDGQTVLQLVYLQDRGAPVALCLMPVASQPAGTFLHPRRLAHAGLARERLSL